MGRSKPDSISSKKKPRYCCLKACQACIKHLEALNANITNLNVTSINGIDTKCAKFFKNTNSRLRLESDALVNPGDFNQEVWDRLVAKTFEIKSGLEQRLLSGRSEVKEIQAQYGCNVCPPNELQVSNNVYGTISLYPCSIGCNQKQLLSSVSYNLDVINITGTLDTRVVTVLVQVGYLDPKIPGPDKFVYETIDFGSRQFDATLDTLYGEKYTGTVVLPTDLITLMSNLNQRDTIVQLVVFAEDGVQIDFPLRARSRNVPTQGPVDSEYTIQDWEGPNLTDVNNQLVFQG